MKSSSKLQAGIGLGLMVATLCLSPGPATAAGITTVQYRDFNRQDDYRDQRRNDDRGGGYGVPGGSYQRSCGEAHMDGSTLVAVCTGYRGARFETSIDMRRCGRSDVGNNNGTLQCGGSRGGSRRVD